MRDATSSSPPTSYWVWLAGVGLSSLGTQVLGFGLVWHAASAGAILASAVLAAQVVPRVTLGLAGGVLSDWLGPIRVMLGANAALAVIALFFSTTAQFGSVPPWSLIVVAILLGTADAFNIPASGAMPKFLVQNNALPRALAGLQIVAQIAALTGPALGGVVTASLGLPATFGTGLLGYLGIFTIVVVLSRRIPWAPDRAARGGGGVLAQAREGLMIVASNHVLRTIVLLTGAFAMFILPYTTLIVPLVARGNHWSPVTAGSVGACYAVGAAAVTLLVLWRGTVARAGMVGAIGMFVSGLGVLGTALAPTPVLMAAAAAIAGCGTGAFSTHVGPVFVAAAPREAMGRVQAVNFLAQSLPLLVANPMIGAITDAASASTAAAVWSVGAMVAGIGALVSRTFRGSGLGSGSEFQAAADQDRSESVGQR